MARVVIFRRPGYVTLPMRWPVTSGSLALSQRRLPPGMQGAINSYLDGAANSIGRARVGIAGRGQRRLQFR